jgi:hypothetical protein
VLKLVHTKLRKNEADVVESTAGAIETPTSVQPCEPPEVKPSECEPAGVWAALLSNPNLELPPATG